MARDRSPAAVARAFFVRRDPTKVPHDDDWQRVVALVRAVRRECARVARRAGREREEHFLVAHREAPVDLVARSTAACVARDILALNRAPQGGRRRGQ